MAGSERPAHVLPVPRWTLLVHGVQLLFAIIILGLAAFGVHWIPYNALIFSLVTCILTFAICAYMVATQLFLHALYNMYLALALHILMIIFWIVDMGLTANLARLWAAPECVYIYGYGYSCTYGKRDLHSLGKREEVPTIKTYYGALAAGAFFCAVELGLWVLATIILVLYINKHRSGATTQSQIQAAQAPPPQYPGNGQSVPMEKYNQSAPPQPVYQQPQQSYSTPQSQYAQPVPQPQGQYVQPPQPAYNKQPPYPNQYPQDPIPRESTVSPVSQVSYVPPPQNTSELGTQHQALNYHPSVSELSSPQHAGSHNPNASELSSQQQSRPYNSDLPELMSK